MNISAFTVHRPIFTIMVTLIVILIGFVSLSRLPIDLLPEVSYPTLNINTSFGNAAPEEVERLITEIIEGAVSAIQGVEEVTSTSSEGNSSVRISFSWGMDLDAASNDVRDRLDRVMNNLPEDIDRPQIRKFDPNSAPILILGASSDLDPIELRRLIDDQISYRIEQVPGVASLDIWGGLEREIRIEIDSDRLRALQLSLDTVRDAIRNANITLPAGRIESGNTDIRLRTPGELTDIDQLKDLVIATRDETAIYLNQVATIEDSHAEISRIVRINGVPGVRLAVRKQSGTNTVEVARETQRVISEINRDFPQIDIITVIDTSKFIERSIANVATSVMYGGILALFVLLFFLRNIRATLVVATAIPIAAISTFAMMYFGGMTLNLMTMGGLALGVGMIVDNSIVVLENIMRRREQLKEKPRDAAIKGANEVSGAIIASTMTTLAIFVPMLFMQEMSGLLFRQLTYVVAFALICSLVAALTLVPMLTRLFLNARAGEQPSRFHAVTRRAKAAFDQISSTYEIILDAGLRRPGMTVLLVCGLFCGALAMFPLIGTEFMPSSDEGEVRVNIDMAGGTRLEVIDETMQKVESVVIENVPEIESMVVQVGAAGGRGNAAGGNIRISLVPAMERTRSSEQVAADLRDAIGIVPGARVRVRAGQGLFLLSRLIGGDGEDNLEVEIRGYDLDTLDVLAQEVEALLNENPRITDTRRSREEGVPQLLLDIDRARAADLGLSVSQIARTLETALSGTNAGRFRDGSGEDVRILVKLRDSERLNVEELLTLTMTNQAGESVSLRNFMRPREAVGPVDITRKNQQRMVTVSANINGPTGAIAAEAQQAIQSLPRPRGYEIVMAGDFEAQQDSFREMMLSIILAILLVYMVMACLYESLLSPVIVMFAVPLPLIGVVLTLYITGTTFNVQSFIGCIMLVGIVVNNAILIVDRTNTLFRDEEKPLIDAVRQAGLDRLRPVLMTSLTTILSLLPLALGLGEGADMQAPLARTVMGGLLSAALITLVFIPALYVLFNRRTEQRRSMMNKEITA